MPRTIAKLTGNGSQNREDLIAMRNHLLVARFYYWTEIKRLRFDDAVQHLSTKEFFVGERTITNALSSINYAGTSSETNSKNFKKLQKEYPGFNWK